MYIYVYIYINMYLYIHMCVCIGMYMCIYTIPKSPLIEEERAVDAAQTAGVFRRFPVTNAFM